jgi:hypothetical protein
MFVQIRLSIVLVYCIMCCIVDKFGSVSSYFLEICDVWLTFIHMDAHTFALVLITILLEPFLCKDPSIPCVSTI